MTVAQTMDNSWFLLKKCEFFTLYLFTHITVANVEVEGSSPLTRSKAQKLRSYFKLGQRLSRNCLAPLRNKMARLLHFIWVPTVFDHSSQRSHHIWDNHGVLHPDGHKTGPRPLIFPPVLCFSGYGTTRRIERIRYEIGKGTDPSFKRHIREWR